jgi:hypothetical protein
MNLDYWNGNSFYPQSCADCIGMDGNLTDYHKYQLEQDPNIRMAYISSKQDETFAFLTQGGGAAFETQLIEAADELNAEFPDRFNSLIADGDEHTFIISQFDYGIAGTTVKQWVAEMVEEDENWNSVSD